MLYSEVIKDPASFFGQLCLSYECVGKTKIIKKLTQTDGIRLMMTILATTLLKRKFLLTTMYIIYICA